MNTINQTSLKIDWHSDCFHKENHPFGYDLVGYSCWLRAGRNFFFIRPALILFHHLTFVSWDTKLSPDILVHEAYRKKHESSA